MREHLYCSPKGMQQKYGEDIYQFGYSGKISVKDPRIIESLHKYWNAVVPLSEYKDNFIVPEVWIPEGIKLEGIDKIQFQK
ncbi:hypothetical protein HYX03_02450 [Candidatus Woesearchaeota archaeon]|nr:hypothetical protein [Candidatus Woesearchaeota archaeon]